MIRVFLCRKNFGKFDIYVRDDGVEKKISTQHTKHTYFFCVNLRKFILIKLKLPFISKEVFVHRLEIPTIYMSR